MEWAKEKAWNATNTVIEPVTKSNESNESNGNATDKAKETAKGTANQATENATGMASAAAGQVSENTNTAAIINSPPFNSFKPDPSIVWQGHLIYVLLAAACTLPWWAFIFAADYFQYLYPGTHIIRLFPFAYFVAWVIAYLLVISFWREGSPWIKIILGGTVSIVALVVIPLLDGLLMRDKGTTATFWATLAVVAVAGCADAISQGSLLGISSELPESFTKAYCCGLTASGVFVFIVRVITKTSLSDSGRGLRISGIVYFSVAALFVVLVLGLFSYIHYMPEMSYYNSLNLGSMETVRLLIQDEGNVTIEVASGAAIAAVAAGRSNPAKPLTWRPVLDYIKVPAIAVLVTSSLTLCVFPGLLAEDVPAWSELGDYSILILFGTFIISDLCGRLYTINHMTRRQSTTFGTAWARLFLVALFFLALSIDPSVISSITMMMVLTAILGFSNGYLISTLTILAPKGIPGKQAETAGILNALFMNLGVLVGAGLSWIGLFLV